MLRTRRLVDLPYLDRLCHPLFIEPDPDGDAVKDVTTDLDPIESSDDAPSNTADGPLPQFSAPAEKKSLATDASPDLRMPSSGPFDTSDAFSKAFTGARSAQIYSPFASTFDALSDIVTSYKFTPPPNLLDRIVPRNLFRIPAGLIDGIVPRNLLTIPPGLVDRIVPRNSLTIPSGLLDGIIPRDLFTLPPGTIDGLLPKITFELPTGLFDRFELLTDSLRDALRLAAASARRHIPSNWRDLDIPDGEILNQLVLEEGLPLAWVPPEDILNQLLTAPDAQARRQIIGRHSPRILVSCENAMDNITSSTGRRYRRFVASAIHSIQYGHREAGQALATNTLDTVLGRHGRQPKNRNNRPKLEEMRFRDALVIGALWRAYFNYHPEQTPPRWFGRHPTAHGVSSQQYNLRNATLAVMHLTAAVRWLELDGWDE